jgi:N-acetyl-gamma-glutamyl-phosphate reductase
MTIVTPAAHIDSRPTESPVTPEPARARARIGLLGATGYSGQEFIRMAIGHPGLELKALASREHAGQPVGTLLPGIDPRVHQLPAFVDPNAIAAMLADGAIDTVVSCLPHGAWKAYAAEHPVLEERAARIIDLSSDHRDGSGGYVYGLPEAFRAEITDAPRVANPGCYPTAAALALLPAAEAGWLDGPIMVSALSGVSGAGRSPALRTSFVELEGGAALYKAGTGHQHVPEMERVFGRIAGSRADVAFAPQLAPMARGILLTATATLARESDTQAALELYRARYANETFVRVLEPDQWPETRSVKTSNRCDVAVTVVHGGRTLMAATALDNLVKGAAGQAIQNLNLMLGWPEDWGLPLHGTPW